MISFLFGLIVVVVGVPILIVLIGAILNLVFVAFGGAAYMIYKPFGFIYKRLEDWLVHVGVAKPFQQDEVSLGSDTSSGHKEIHISMGIAWLIIVIATVLIVGVPLLFIV